MARGRPRSCSLPYVPLDPHIDEHAKTEALVDALSGCSSIPPRYIVEVPQKLIKLAGRKCVDGVLGHLSDNAIARACAWDGDPTVLRAALVETGWLEHDDTDGYRIHDWQDYGGIVLARREENRARKAAERARKGAKKKTKQGGRIVTRTSARRHSDVTHMSHDTSQRHAHETPNDAGDNTNRGAQNGSNDPCVSTEKQSDDGDLDGSGELSRGHPRDVTVTSRLEGEGKYKKQPPPARARLVAPKSEIAAAAVSPTAKGEGEGEGHVQWLIDHATPGLPAPSELELQRLRQLGRVDPAAWAEATSYAKQRSARSPWAYAAHRAVARGLGSQPANTALRIDSGANQTNVFHAEIMRIASENGMGKPPPAVLDGLVSLHAEDAIHESVAEYCAEKEGTGSWPKYLEWERKRRRNAAVAAMREIEKHGFSVPKGDYDDGYHCSNGAG